MLICLPCLYTAIPLQRLRCGIAFGVNIDLHDLSPIDLELEGEGDGDME